MGDDRGSASNAELDALRDELRALRDVEEIKQLKARYVRLVDAQDWDAWRDLLTDDFRLESDGGVHEGRDAVVARVSSGLAGATTVHHVLAPEISLTGRDEATGTWVMEDFVALPGSGTPISFRGYGHYHEQYVRTAEGWRVRSSVQTRLRIEPIEGVLPATDRSTTREGS